MKIWFWILIPTHLLGSTRMQGDIRELPRRWQSSKVGIRVWQIEVPNSTERHMGEAWTVTTCY
jgi:hypothetical protein